MGFGSLIASLFKSIEGLFAWLQQSQLLKAGERGAEADQLQEQVREIEIAVDAREAARVGNAAVPVTDSLPDDGFRRD